MLLAVLPDELIAPRVERAQHTPVPFKREVAETRTFRITGIERSVAPDDAAS